MSVLIKGAEVPKSCAECDFIEYDDEYEYECWCPITRSNVEEYTAEKPASCPLVEIPPHGRLIDADKLKNDTYENCRYCTLLHQEEVRDIIDNAPTVIESEE